MFVLFVSQCKKKSLNKTRRVLDTFADRIGDNVWKTVITEDGLLAVKNLLKRTASKNTAVACHLLKTRIRSDLLWVVGNRKEFDENGNIPVHWTEKEIKVDIMGVMDKNKYYANTHGQLLDEHLFSVGCIAAELAKFLLPNEEKKNIVSAAYIAGCLHDIGKIDPNFQEWVKNPKSVLNNEDGQHITNTKFSFEKHPRHNELSVLFSKLLNDQKCLSVNNNEMVSYILHSILWHHAKPFRSGKDESLFSSYENIMNLAEENFKNEKVSDIVKDKVLPLLVKIDVLASNCGYESLLSGEDFQKENIESITVYSRAAQLPDYKCYKEESRLSKYKEYVKYNAHSDIVRSCVITADRWVSALTPSELKDMVHSNGFIAFVNEKTKVETSLSIMIEECLLNFPSGERSEKQAIAAESLSKQNDVVVLAGPAGCGKTKIALEWAQRRGVKKMIWVCPRVQICQGIFNELTSEQYLSSSNVEIFTGEFKYTKNWENPTPEGQYFSGDIVITTIDQLLGTIISHNNANTLIDFMNSHVVFDEYHEYVNMPAFNLLFAELIEVRRCQNQKANTLLVSATPNYYFLEHLLNIDKENIVKMESFNRSKYKMIFEEVNEENLFESALYRPHTDEGVKKFVISNTATSAQQSFIWNLSQEEGAVLLHSKFIKSDKKRLFNEVFDCFKKGGTRHYNVLRSGPIVQASLNISCDVMVSEMTTPENLLQRMGRLDRFGENTNDQKPNQIVVCLFDGVKHNKQKDLSSRFLASLSVLGTTYCWYQFISQKPLESFDLNMLYEWYDEFYDCKEYQKTFEEDLLASLKASACLISEKIIDPMTINKTSSKNSKPKIGSRSLRGENRFVQLALASVDVMKGGRLGLSYQDNYAYEITTKDNDDCDNVTLSKEDITGFGDSSKNLLAYMVSKQHNIFGSKKYKDFVVLDEAKDPESPIYLSYTPSHLDLVGGESARHTEAIYYFQSEAQPIGILRGRVVEQTLKNLQTLLQKSSMN